MSDDARITELLEANNREVERRRAAEAERDRLRKIVDACGWYWPNGETDSENCRWSVWEAVENEAPGVVHYVDRGGIVETIWCARLPPAEDADSDDEWTVEAPTEEAAEAALQAEIERRAALVGTREAGE